MTNSRLIILEGLPGTGKSTNSSFLHRQLERNGYQVKWIHEVARPQPLQLFCEACFTWDEYLSFLKAFPEARDILNHVAVFYEHTVGIDLLEIEWNYLHAIGERVYRALKEYDAWSADSDKCGVYLWDKWRSFSQQAIRDKDCIYILDSSVFQFNIWGYLLENAPYEDLERFIFRLIDLLRPLNPALIYLYRENVEHAIGFLEKKRGIQDLEKLWERDHENPYYRDKPKGAAGFKRFLKDYAAIAERLFGKLDCTKTMIDLSDENWERCEEQMLSFLEIHRKAYVDAVPPCGVYRNDPLGLTMKIDDFILQDPEGVARKLTPKSKNEFYVECLPTILRFDESKQIVVTAGQIGARWTSLGTVYHLTTYA